MFHSIKSKLIAAVIVMAVLLGALIFLTSLQMKSIESTLSDLQKLNDVKSHVLIPQKDMNQFLAAMESAELFLELGDAEGAQDAYDESVDAEQDISVEFIDELKPNVTGELAPLIKQAHVDWEIATEFLKIKVEALAEDSGVTLVRPSVDPTKSVDADTEAAIATAQDLYGGKSYAELAEIQDDDATNPIEIADEGIDGSEDKVDEILAAEQADGEQAVKNSASTVLLGSLGVLAAILLVGLVVTTSVSRPLAELKTGAEKIAEGDLDYEFKNVPADEVGAVIHSVESMAGGLKSRIRNLEEVAGIVMVTGEEIGNAAKASDMAAVSAKAEQLKGLVGQMLADTQGK
jgi:methyl-accepting chemotaxis protein